MARPTEPGWYWLMTPACGCGAKYCTNKTETWEIVRVGMAGGVLGIIDREEYTALSRIADDRWGGRITQEPVTDPPPPF